jgi:hypothetical protein
MIEDIFWGLKKVWQSHRVSMVDGIFAIKMYGPDIDMSSSTSMSDSSSSSSNSSVSNGSSSSGNGSGNIGYSYSHVPGKGYTVYTGYNKMVMHLNLIIPNGRDVERDGIGKLAQVRIAKALNIPTAKVARHNMFSSWSGGQVIMPQVFYAVQLPAKEWSKPDTLNDVNLSSVDLLWRLSNDWREESEAHEMEWTLNKI